MKPQHTGWDKTHVTAFGLLFNDTGTEQLSLLLGTSEILVSLYK
jgi:hypothetical protein